MSLSAQLLWTRCAHLDVTVFSDGTELEGARRGVDDAHVAQRIDGIDCSDFLRGEKSGPRGCWGPPWAPLCRRAAFPTQCSKAGAYLRGAARSHAALVWPRVCLPEPMACLVARHGCLSWASSASSAIVPS